MANQNNKKRTGKRSSGNEVEKDEGLKPYKDEITIVVTLVVCILLLLADFNMGGVVGSYLSNFFFGIFGVISYLLPIGFFAGIAFYISNKGNKKAGRKLVSTVLLVIDLMAILQMLTGEETKVMNPARFYEYSSSERLGGGIIGGFISKGLINLFGTVGAVVVLLGIGVLLFMFISEKFIFAYLGNQSSKKMKAMKEQKGKRKQELQEAYYSEEKQGVKRKAKTFRILPEKEQSNSEAKTNIDEVPADMGGKKKKFNKHEKQKNKKNEKNLPVGMEEILPKKFDDFPIERSGTVIKAKDGDSIPVYEEELVKKFNPVHAKMDSSILDSPKMENRTIIQSVSRKNFEKEKMDIQDIAEENEPIVQGDVLNDVKEKMDKEEIGQPAMIQAQSLEKVQPAKKKEKKVVEGIEIEEINKNFMESQSKPKPYEFPRIGLLSEPSANQKQTSDQELKETAYKLHQTLESFGVRVTIANVSCGPTVTRYELHPEQGVKVSKITNLADDIKLNLAAADIRIEAPIPGKAAVGIEVPNKINSTVMFRELINSQEFKKHSSHIAFGVGKDIGGNTVVSDIGKMPHLLIAGATGSGKSVCINTLIMSILYKASPEDVKLIMVDPKVVELSVYNGIPHLLIPVVTDPKKASAALHWAVAEMTERYKKFAELSVRDMKGYNKKIKKVEYLEDEKYQKMPQIVIIVDELADLMMVAPGEVEESICRIAQLARAAGIHLVIATQRPSVNVITGVIKANIPSRIAFSVSSAVDSRTIIDGAGAEKLLGKGDMLFYPAGFPKPIRVQGAFVSDQEVSSVVEFLTRDVNNSYDDSVIEKITTASSVGSVSGPSQDRDEYFIEAAKFIIEKDKASIGMLQRVFKIGFNRASRMMDQLYDAGVVGEDEGTKPRKVVMSPEQFEQFLEECI